MKALRFAVSSCMMRWEAISIIREAQQMEYIALDSHKRFSSALIQNSDGKIRLETRVDHHPGAIREFLCQC